MLTEEEIEERFEELLKDAPADDFGNMIRRMAKNGLSIEQKEYMIDTGGKSDLSVSKIYNLTARFYLNAKDISESKSNHASGEMFLIQLWMLVDEVLLYFKEQANSVSTFKGFFGIDDAFIECTKEVYSNLSDLKAQMSPEEISMLEYLRIESCHLKSSKYHIQWNKKSNTFVRDLNGIYRADVRESIKNELEKHNSSLEEVSKYFVSKLSTQIIKVMDSVDEWKKRNRSEPSA